MIDCMVPSPRLCLAVCVLSKALMATPGRSTRERWLSSLGEISCSTVTAILMSGCGL